MKKILKLILVIICLTAFMSNVVAKKTTLYMFSKEGCPNCETAENYFNNMLKENKDLFDFVIIEAYDENGRVVTEDAKNLMTATLEEFNEDTTPYFPTIVVGDLLHIGAGSLDEVKDKINSYKDNNEYQDKVQDIASILEIDINKIKRISTEEKQKQESTHDLIILAVIFIVLIGGFGGLILLGKK